MAKNIPFRRNKSVMDVFFFMYMGIRLEHCIKIFGQSRSVVKKKRMFLVKNGIFTNDAGYFKQLNRKIVTEAFQESVINYLENIGQSIKRSPENEDKYIKAKKAAINLVPKLYDETMVRGVMHVFSQQFLDSLLTRAETLHDNSFKDKSFDDLVESFLTQLGCLNNERAKHINQDSKTMRKLIKIMTKTTSKEKMAENSKLKYSFSPLPYSFV